jgi:IS605 OrfB family transposase
VVPAPAGRAVRTRLRVTDDEAALLEAVGQHLTRLRLRDLQKAAAGVPANDRAKALGGQAQARYAGTLVRDNDALVRLVRDGLYRHRTELRAAVETLQRRVAAPTWDSCYGATKRKHACERCRPGYPTRAERAMKCRRLDARRAALARVERRVAERDWRLLPGGRRLATTRHHLEDAELTEAGWRAVWDERRFFLGALGNAGKPGGNPCPGLGPDGRLTVSVPPPVAAALGVPARVTLAAPAVLRHGGDELAARTAARFDIERVERNGEVRWHLRASWSLPPETTPTRAAVTAAGVLGVDLNADHLAAHVVDRCGNPVGAPHRIELGLRDPGTGERLPAATRDARVREAVTQLLDRATAAGVPTVVIEELGFATEEKSRERYGRNRRFRALVAGFPTTAFRGRLAGMAHRRGVAVIAVDPRYTSVVGARDWAPALSATRRPVTGHDGAAVAIGRRGLALPLRAHRSTRRAAGVRPVPHRRMEAPPRRGGGTDTRTPPAAAGRPRRPRPARSRPGLRTAERSRPGWAGKPADRPPGA